MVRSPDDACPDRVPLEERNWAVRGSVLALAGFLFSIGTSVLVVIMLALDFAPAVHFERLGADLTQRIYTSFASGRARVTETADHYVLFDVDAAACAINGQGSHRCTSGNPVPEQVIVPLARAAADAGAKVVIVDVRPPENPTSAALLARRLDAIKGSWIVAPLPTRPAQDAGELVLERSVPHSAGRLRYAAFAAVGPGEGDDMLRHYPASIRVNHRSGGARVLSVPYLAAFLADGSRAADRSGGVFYSVPSLLVGTPALLAERRERMWGIAEVMRASDILKNGRSQLPRGRLLDSIVIVTSSAANGDDQHLTPIGVMSGAEVILNATRTYRRYKPLHRLGSGSGPGELLGVLKAKIRSALLPAVLLLVLFLVRERLLDRTSASRSRRGIRVALLLLSIAAFCLTLLPDVMEGLDGIEQEARVGRSTDLLTPVLLVALDLYRDLATTVVRGTESATLRLLDHAHRIVRAAREHQG